MAKLLAEQSRKQLARCIPRASVTSDFWWGSFEPFLFWVRLFLFGGYVIQWAARSSGCRLFSASCDDRVARKGKRVRGEPKLLWL